MLFFRFFFFRFFFAFFFSDLLFFAFFLLFDLFFFWLLFGFAFFTFFEEKNILLFYRIWLEAVTIMLQAFSIFIQRAFSAAMSQSSCFRMIGHVGTHEA